MDRALAEKHSWQARANTYMQFLAGSSGVE
jgi:hypothetical protein